MTLVQKSGKTYYVFPDAAHNRAYVGGPKQYQAYNNSVWPRKKCLISGAHFCDSAPLETHAFGFRLGANARRAKSDFLSVPGHRKHPPI